MSQPDRNCSENIITSDNHCHLLTAEMAVGDFTIGNDVPLLQREDVLPVMGFSTENEFEKACCYINAATCPDCGAGMVRLGTCFNCLSCGWGSCG